MPVAWVTGEPIRFGDPGVIHERMCTNSASSVRWLCITPFGSLVVPEVYASTHTASGSRGADRRGRFGCVDDVPRDAPHPPRGAGASRRADDDVHLQIRQLAGRRAVDDVEVVDVAVAVGRDVRARAALAEDEAHLLGPVDVHDRHEHVAAHREAVERDDRFAPVRQLERDDVTRLDPGLRERGDQAERVGADLRVGAVPRPRLRPDVAPWHRARREASDRRASPSVVVGPPPLGEIALPERRRHLPHRPRSSSHAHAPPAHD